MSAPMTGSEATGRECSRRLRNLQRSARQRSARAPGIGPPSWATGPDLV
jgi:hypothetical protein